MRSAQRTPTDLRVVIDLKKVVTAEKLLPGAECPDMATDWWSTCSTTLPMPRRRLRQPRAWQPVPAVPVNPSQPQVKLPPPPPAPAGKRDIIVVIDAGHGGEDPGASGSRGQHEKDVVLAIARELQRQINGMKGYRAELTRTGDYFIPLRGRTEIARKKVPTCLCQFTPMLRRRPLRSVPRCLPCLIAGPRPRLLVGWRTAKTVPT